MYKGLLIEILGMGGPEIMLIMVVILLLFGGKKLPELAKGLGKGIREFKDASEGVKREIHRNINSVGITDEIDAIVNDTHTRQEPAETSLEDQMYPKATQNSGINLEKDGDLVAQNANTENTRIETDKTQL